MPSSSIESLSSKFCVSNAALQRRPKFGEYGPTEKVFLAQRGLSTRQFFVQKSDLELAADTFEQPLAPSMREYGKPFGTDKAGLELALRRATEHARRTGARARLADPAKVSCPRIVGFSIASDACW